MATPMVAASAILVKQYFEEVAAQNDESRWNTLCRSTYRSCPSVSSTVDYVSGPLVKAILV